MAKKDVAAIVSGAGWIGSFAGLLIEELEELGVSVENIHRLGKPTKDGRALIKACAEKIAEMVKNAQSEFLVIVNYGQSLAEMIAAGHYDWANSDITAEHFPFQGKGRVESKLELVHFNRSMTTDSVLKEFDKQGLRPVKIEDLLAFGAAYPDKQREFPIICLGSVWVGSNGDRSVPCLDRDDSGRGLRLLWIGSDWGGHCRFLAVRK